MRKARLLIGVLKGVFLSGDLDFLLHKTIHNPAS